MNTIRMTGLSIVVVGVIMFVFPFLITNVNPNVTMGFLGLIVTLLGVLTLAGNSFRKRVRLQGPGFVVALGGWMALASGALISFTGFLLGTQVACLCPASGPCECFVPLYNLMLYGGFIAALTGLAGVVAGAVVSRRRPVAPIASGASASGSIARKKLGKRTTTAFAIVLTVVIVFGVFSYWPGVYITSVNEQMKFIGGVPSVVDLRHPNAPPFMTSPVSEPLSGSQLPIGSNFQYILHFNSVPSYPNYRIDAVSVTNGFSISDMNASLPLVVSPAIDSSVSVSLDVKGPYYPYYGALSFFMTIEELNQSVVG